MNVKIETLDDIFTTIDQLGDAMKESSLAQTAHQSLRARLDAVAKLNLGRPPVRAMIVISSTAQNVAGVGTYLNNLLTLAGGVNVLGAEMGHWPAIDREKLLSLNPEVILQLLPDALPQEREEAAAVWKQLPQFPAVAGGRVYPIYEGYALLPGWHVADLAEKFNRCLHP